MRILKIHIQIFHFFNSSLYDVNIYSYLQMFKIIYIVATIELLFICIIRKNFITFLWGIFIESSLWCNLLGIYLWYRGSYTELQIS
jgi:hypothetical protein